MARKQQTSTAKKAKALADQAVSLADYGAKALVAAEQLRMKTKAVDGLTLAEEERTALAGLSAITAKIKKKLTTKDATFTVAEVASMVMAVADSFPDAESKQQLALLLVAK